MNSAPTLTRPLLRYHGGKWTLAPWIIAQFPEHRIYVEPFGGAGSVLLRKPRSFSEVYNDLDRAVVELFRILRCREDTLKLCDLLSLTPFSREDFNEAYEPAPAHDRLEQARRLIIRSMFGFGATGMLNVNYRTGFRSCSKRTGRPHAMDWVNYPECLYQVTERLKGVMIENRDALEVIAMQDDPQTLFYVDPPYLQSLRKSASKQYAFEFAATQHAQLAQVLHRVQGKVIVSGYPCPFYDNELYGDWRRLETGHRAGGQNHGVARTEVLWLNWG